MRIEIFFFKELIAQNRVPSSSISDSPSVANLQNKQNRDQQYLAVRCNPGNNRNSNSLDSGSYKAEGNGNELFLEKTISR